MGLISLIYSVNENNKIIFLTNIFVIIVYIYVKYKEKFYFNRILYYWYIKFFEKIK